MGSVSNLKVMIINLKLSNFFSMPKLSYVKIGIGLLKIGFSTCSRRMGGPT